MVLFKDPSRRNVFHQILEVDKIETTLVSVRFPSCKTTEHRCYIIAIYNQLKDFTLTPLPT